MMNETEKTDSHLEAAESHSAHAHIPIRWTWSWWWSSWWWSCFNITVLNPNEIEYPRLWAYLSSDSPPFFLALFLKRSYAQCPPALRNMPTLSFLIQWKIIVWIYFSWVVESEVSLGNHILSTEWEVGIPFSQEEGGVWGFCWGWGNWGCFG